MFTTNALIELSTPDFFLCDWLIDGLDDQKINNNKSLWFQVTLISLLGLCTLFCTCYHKKSSSLVFCLLSSRIHSYCHMLVEIIRHVPIRDNQHLSRTLYHFVTKFQGIIYFNYKRPHYLWNSDHIRFRIRIQKDEIWQPRGTCK